MSLSVEQIIYTSFANVGFQSCVSAAISQELQLAFLQKIVYQYWNPYDPPSAGYRGVYVQQISGDQTFFGWLYNDGSDDLGRAHIPYFIGYFLAKKLDISQLNMLWHCLAVGPIFIINRDNQPTNLESVIIPDDCHYQSPRSGVYVNENIRRKNETLLKQGLLINQFVAEAQQNTNLNFHSLSRQSVEQSTDKELIPLSSGLPLSQRKCMKTSTLEKILQDLVNKPIGIQAAALVSQEGQPISVPIGMDEHSTSIISGSMLYLAQSTQHEFNWQDVETVSIRGKEGHIILAYCRQEVYLFIKAGKVLTGLLEGEIGRTVKQLQAILNSLDSIPLQSELLPQFKEKSVYSEPEILEEFPQPINRDTNNEIRYRGRPIHGS